MRLRNDPLKVLFFSSLLKPHTPFQKKTTSEDESGQMLFQVHSQKLVFFGTEGVYLAYLYYRGLKSIIYIYKHDEVEHLRFKVVYKYLLQFQVY